MKKKLWKNLSQSASLQNKDAKKNLLDWSRRHNVPRKAAQEIAKRDDISIAEGKKLLLKEIARNFE